MLRRILLAVPLAAALLLSPAPGGLPAVREAAASVSLAIAFEDLAGAAQRVVLGAPAESHAVWEDVPDIGRRIVTYTRVRVERTAVGEEAADVWVRTMGGRVGRIGQTVDGEAQVGAGPALLFLRDRGDGTEEVVGMAQGRYPVGRGADGLLRLEASAVLGEILPRSEARPPALRVLPGLTIDDAVARIVAARRPR
jgi:hypothetical protein